MQLYSELNHELRSSRKLIHIASRVDSTTLADDTYELVLESESEQREAQANLTEATEDPNQSSEEPKANFA